MTTFDAERITRGNWETIPFLGRTEIVVDHAERGFVRLRMPFEPNVNHVGMMYAGALFTLAEVPGGHLFLTRSTGRSTTRSSRTSRSVSGDRR